MDAMEVTQGGPDTHDDPHETGAARTAARPLLGHNFMVAADSAAGLQEI